MPVSDEAAVDGSARVQELADFYRFLAHGSFDGYCEPYARIARAMADDPELLEQVVELAPAAKILPVLLNAAVHHLVLGDPDSALAACYRDDPGAPSDPWPLYRTLVVDRFEELRELVTTRTIQTNEVGRSSVLLAAFTAIHERAGRPLTLIELGPSAGLNLLFDRFGHRYGDGVVAGDAASPVQLSCGVMGDLVPPRPTGALPVARRLGIDLAPVDVTDPEACRWLEACIWPRLTDRAERLRAAMALARTDPPDLRQGDALELLGPVVDETDPDTVVVVFATWVLAYVSREGRAQVGELLDAIGSRRDLAFVSGEYPSIAPGIERPDRPAAVPSPDGSSLVGLQTWLGGERIAGPIAWCHEHGAWLDWVDPSTASRPSAT